MTKEIIIIIGNGRLEISKEKTFYMVTDKNSDLFIHADKLEYGSHDYKQGWLLMLDKQGYNIGSIWINTKTDMQTVTRFLEDTKPQPKPEDLQAELKKIFPKAEICRKADSVSITQETFYSGDRRELARLEKKYKTGLWCDARHDKVFYLFHTFGSR